MPQQYPWGWPSEDVTLHLPSPLMTPAPGSQSSADLSSALPLAVSWLGGKQDEEHVLVDV